MTNNLPKLKITVILSYLLMIAVNALANILPINNLTTGEVSAIYPNLFAPAPLTFSIWGIIYLLLGIYSVNQLVSKKLNQKLSTAVNKYFVGTSVINSVWIFAWHYRLMGLTVILMLLLLFFLIKITDIINKEKLELSDRLLYKVPFGVYFGWITVAAIANITAFLVSLGWGGFGLPDTFWMIVVLLVGCAISVWRMQKDSSVAYGIVPVWAYFGIWLKHTSTGGFNSSYPTIVTMVLVLIVLLLLSNALLVIRKKAI